MLSYFWNVFFEVDSSFDNFKDLTIDYWKEYLKKLSESIVLEPKYWYESRNIGGGCPPIETDKGWLLIYHAVQDTAGGSVYRASAALFDKNNPRKVIGRLENPLFGPEEDWEVHGDVNNVVFPEGTALFGDKLYIYYGAADKCIATVSVNINELLDELLNMGQQIDPHLDIGVTAGQVFNACLKQACSITQLKESLHKDDSLILMAVGWLAKEGKIDFLAEKGNIKIEVNDQGNMEVFNNLDHKFMEIAIKLVNQAWDAF